MTIELVFLILALIAFLAAAANATARINLVGAGLALLVLAMILRSGPRP